MNLPLNRSRPKRPRHPMPDFIQEALKKSHLLEAYESRPPYQQNGYIGWITRAVQEATKQKRLQQMLAELASGGAYMGMAWGKGGRPAAAGKTAAPASVDDYLTTVTPEMRAVLAALRNEIKAAAPRAEEFIYYGIPTYRYHGSLVHFMAHPKHSSFIVVSKATLGKFKEELKEFKISGTTVHFSPEHPLPAGLVKKIVKFRMKENEAKQAVTSGH